MSKSWVRAMFLAVGCGLLCAAGGCQWIDHWKGPGFSGWQANQGTGFRQSNPSAKPSGLFFDRRSEQIENDLGINQ